MQIHPVIFVHILYVAGTDPELDRAIKLYPAFEKFLHQNMSQQENFVNSLEKLTQLFDSEETR